MRSTARSKKAAADDDRGERWLVLQTLGWSRTDAAAFGVVVFAVIVVVVNGLMLQTGPHPAPMFKGEPQVATRTAPAAPKEVTVAALPRARPVAASTPKADPARANVEVVSDIQRELARRGFYDGAVDGRYGSRTDAAVREFEQAAGAKPSIEPNEALLAAIKGSNAKSAKTVTAGVRSAPPARHDAIAEALAPSKRVLAVQRALAEYGYGQIKQTGIVDADTRAAVEKFERERKLPVTGQVSDRVTRELASITGRPLE